MLVLILELMKELVLEFILSPTKKMTTINNNAYIEYKQYIDSLIKELKECKDNQKCEQLLQFINHCQRDIQTLYDNGDFDLELSALEPEPEPELVSDGEYTDEQMRLDMEFANEYINECNNDDLRSGHSPNINFDSDTPMF